MFIFKLPEELHLASTKMGSPIQRACFPDKDTIAVGVGRHEQMFAIGIFDSNGKAKTVKRLGNQQLHQLTVLDPQTLFVCHLWGNCGYIHLRNEPIFEEITDTKDALIHDAVRLTTGELLVGSWGAFTDTYGSCILEIFPNGRFNATQGTRVFNSRDGSNRQVVEHYVKFEKQLEKLCIERGDQNYHSDRPEFHRLFEFSEGKLLFSVHSRHRSGSNGAAIGVMDLHADIVFQARAMTSGSFFTNGQVEYAGEHIFLMSKDSMLVMDKGFNDIARFQSDDFPFKGFSLIGSSSAGDLALYSARLKTVCWITPMDLQDIPHLGKQFNALVGN